MKMSIVGKINQDDVWSHTDVDIAHEGTKIVLPASPGPMPLREAIKALERKAEDEETELAVHEVIDAFPEDALVALNAAMREKYGWASPTPKMSFFGPIPPTLLTVKTGYHPKESIQVPYGLFTLPGVENPVETVRHNTPNGAVLVIVGTVRKREASVVKELAELARQILRERSIYKGKAIRLKFDEDGDLDIDEAPEFLDTDSIRPEELILNQVELEQVQSALWTPIQHTDACIKHGIPLNRGVLLEGIYGTGKTMTANVTSRVCVDNGWTYILLDDVRGLKDALLFAQRYAPAVVFAEDADRAVAVRDQRGNDILNTIDGVLTKNSKVITVLTTNHVERLDKAMLRPGRLDAVISIKAPEGPAVEKLIRLYGRDLVGQIEDLTEVGEYLAGNIPATIREVVERSKLTMIANGRDHVTQEDLLISARGMKYHLELLSEPAAEVSIEQQLGDALGKLVASRSGIDGDEVDRLQDTINNGVASFSRLVQMNSISNAGVQEAAQNNTKKVGGELTKIGKKVSEIHEATV